jgi:hypothetical protein
MIFVKKYISMAPTVKHNFTKLPPLVDDSSSYGISTPTILPTKKSGKDLKDFGFDQDGFHKKVLAKLA